MKKIFLILLVVFSTLTVHAQEGQEWHTDLGKAMTISKKTKKPLFLFFTGSDWCGWCIKLQKEVFKTPEFTKWAKENVVLLELDFPRRTPQAEELKNQNGRLNAFFKVQGYPTVWFTNATQGAEGGIEFSPLGNIGYVAGGPDAWIAGANKVLANK
ncbi:thioredoxin family protein [Flavobacterium cerinum]|uniref:Thioredoxin family protein n=1 Tax=Flavobacterium cerinum TaxID=2502784 RepID=A0A3S3RLL2_9FLAO|nr:thioredoxin family protein [Flavobacterium cerinum]RWX03657.1 thioredoxin family protein [Flavobacterium cerinum]